MGRPSIVATVTGVVVLLGSVAVPPVAAVPPTPVPPVVLPAEVDNATHYDPQRECDSSATPGAAALAQLLVDTYGPATTYITRACTSSTSEHFDGRAVDWMRSVRDPGEKEMADSFVAWLLAPAVDGTPHEMARRLGIMYVIWDNRMIRMYDPGRGWTDYRGCMDPSKDAKSLDTTCHRNHVHLSMSWDGAAMATSWWTGVAQTRPWCPSGGSGAAPGTGEVVVVPDPGAVPGAVAVPATPVLDTRAGSGAGLVGPCRIGAGRVVHPQAAVPGIIPADATSVVLQLTTTSTAPAHVAVWSSGGSRPDGQLSVPMGTATSHVVVPLASDGSIAIGTSQGALDVAAAVVGYRRADAPPIVPAAGGSGDGTGQQASAGPDGEAEASRPSKPRRVKAKGKRRSVKVRWKAPRADGGSPVTGYTVLALKGKRKGAKVAGSCTAGPDRRSCKVRGLKKRKYWISVSVANEAGTSWAKRKKVRVRR